MLDQPLWNLPLEDLYAVIIQLYFTSAELLKRWFFRRYDA
jgi:hypothetical protein